MKQKFKRISFRETKISGSVNKILSDPSKLIHNWRYCRFSSLKELYSNNFLEKSASHRYLEK